jgi:LysR family tcuABC transcriptional regulator
VRLPADEMAMVEIADKDALRRNLLASLSDDELSPAGLAARVVLVDTVRQLVEAGRWPGASTAAVHES